MALFDNNPLYENISSLANPITSSIGGLFKGMTPFGSSIPEGILTSDQEDKLRNQALFQGLLGTAATYLATPKNLNAGSPLPYIGKAFLGGMGASQDVIDRALTAEYRKQLTANRGDNIRTINQDIDGVRYEVTYQIDPKTGKQTEIARSKRDVEQKEKPLDIERLINIKEKLIAEDPNNPNIPIYDDLIQNLRVKKEGLNINLNQPIPVINPKTGKAELVQFPNKPGEKPLFTGLEKAEPEARLKPIPSGPATAYAENNAAMKAVDDAIAKVEKAGENTFGLKNYLPGAVTQRIDRAGIDARSAVSAIGSKKYHDISGAAVTISEAPRMAPFIPSSSDTKEKILQNLRNIKTQYEDTNNSLSSVYNEDQGYRSLNVSPKVLNKPTEKNQPQNTLPATQQNRAYIGNRAIIVKGNKWVYEDTGEVAQ